MKKNLLLKAIVAICCILTVTTGSAQVKYLIVNRTDGSQVSFALADDPRVQNSATELIVSSASTTITVPFSELKNYTFSDTETTEVVSVKTDPTHFIDGESIIFTGLKANEDITIYSLEGRQMSRWQANASGQANVDISQLGQGIYIVKTSSSSFKFIKK